MSWSGPPLVCTAGWPNTAVFILCHQLRESGCDLLHHGDFDPSGLEITRYLSDRAGVRPWRMGKDDYVQLAAKSDTQLTGTVGPTPWDPGLATAMEATGKVVYEEDCVGELLDLLLPRRCQDAGDPA